MMSKPLLPKSKIDIKTTMEGLFFDWVLVKSVMLPTLTASSTLEEKEIILFSSSSK